MELEWKCQPFKLQPLITQSQHSCILRSQIAGGECMSITRMLVNWHQAANYASNNAASLTTQRHFMARLSQATQTGSRADAGCDIWRAKPMFQEIQGGGRRQLFAKLGEKAAGICEPQREECFGTCREHVNVGLRLHNYRHGDNGIINNSNICLSQTKGCGFYTV